MSHNVSIFILNSVCLLCSFSGCLLSTSSSPIVGVQEELSRHDALCVRLELDTVVTTEPILPCNAAKSLKIVFEKTALNKNRSR